MIKKFELEMKGKIALQRIKRLINRMKKRNLLNSLFFKK